MINSRYCLEFPFKWCSGNVKTYFTPDKYIAEYGLCVCVGGWNMEQKSRERHPLSSQNKQSTEGQVTEKSGEAETPSTTDRYNISEFIRPLPGSSTEENRSPPSVESQMSGH